MKKSSTLFLKVIILLVAIGTVSGLIWFPQTEGRAANLDLVSIYLDPFILYVYLASIPFFVGLFQTIKLLNLIDGNKAFSQEAVNTLRIMKFASIILIGLIVLAEFYLHIFVKGEDIAGPTMLGIFASLAFGVIATAISIFQKIFQKAIDLKSENDLTV